MGLKITADDIYNINKSSLKDAIMLFGGGCTGELVSDQGLVLTNHHCGYDQIQKHSSLEHDYLTNGFWAQSLAEELPNPGLSVEFLIRMEDVTQKVLEGVTASMSQAEREKIVSKNCKAIEKQAIEGSHYKAYIKPFYSGNQYYLFVNEVFTDVRLVGAPPSNIGKFGGDTDNWVWPRHTGDFSVFRIYANKDNKPADYSKENVPYQPKKYLKISLKGIQEGDFSFIFGYPGTTREYLPSQAVNMYANERNPIAIDLRGKRLDIIKAAMDADKLTRIQYSSKAASISNGWKKWIGESMGIERFHAIEKKQTFEKQFSQWAQTASGGKYQNLLETYGNAYNEYSKVYSDFTYLAEGPLSVELIRYTYSFDRLVKNCNDPKVSDSTIRVQINRLKAAAETFFQNYDRTIDQKIFTSLFSTCITEKTIGNYPELVSKMVKKHHWDFANWAATLYGKTMFTDKQKVTNLLANFKRSDAKKIEKDEAYTLAVQLYQKAIDEFSPKLDAFSDQLDSLQRIYMAAQMEFQPDKRFYPDANLTLRVAYGFIQGNQPADGVDYKYYTTLEGIMAKENPDIYDYVVEPKLKQLFQTKDYGRYAAKDGKIHVAFLASNHTTGGNSGSPVLDGNGNLIGINFDRTWESTMSDLMYDPEICRNIALDIRYCLFVIDKFAGAKRLVDEMTIVE